MLKRILLLSFLVFAMISLCGCQGPQPTPSPEKTAGAPSPAALQALPGDLVFLSFSESSSYFKRVQGYDFQAENGAYTAYFWMAHEEEPYPVQVDQKWVNALTDIVWRNEMIRWDGFSGSDSMLLDGTHFSITLKFSDETTVLASGYGIFPEHYGDASQALDAHFLQLLPEDMRDW